MGSLAGDGGPVKAGCPLDKGRVAFTHPGLLLAHPLGVRDEALIMTEKSEGVVLVLNPHWFIAETTIKDEQKGGAQ